jgi:hypothetical protein
MMSLKLRIISKPVLRIILFIFILSGYYAAFWVGGLVGSRGFYGYNDKVKGVVNGMNIATHNYISTQEQAWQTCKEVNSLNRELLNPQCIVNQQCVLKQTYAITTALGKQQAFEDQLGKLNLDITDKFQKYVEQMGGVVKTPSSTN